MPYKVGGEGSSSSSSFVIKKQPSTSSASATAPSASATTLKAKKISSPAPKAVTYYDDEEGADEGEEYLPGAHYSGTNAAGKPIKRNMSLASAGASTSTDYYEGIELHY